MDSFEEEGVFWLPDNEDRQLVGRLTFDSIEGATLKLTGLFDDIQAHLMRSGSSIRIHGVAGRRYLTLDRCFTTNTALDWPGAPRISYSVGLIIAGHLFGQNEPLTFDKCSVEFDQLPNWVRRSGVAVQATAPTDTQIVNHIDITFDKLVDEIVRFGDEELTLSSTWLLGGDNLTETSLFQATQLGLIYPVARPLDDILSDIKCLQDIVTLATTAPAVPTIVKLWRQDIIREQPEFAPGDPKPQAMEYYAGQIAARVCLNEPQPPDRVMFAFQAIGGLATIARWIGVARHYGIVVDSLLSIRYSAGLYVQNRFHNVVSAAESFHRLRFSNEVRPKEEFKACCREIVKAVPKEHRNWLGNQLQYSNEPRLHQRLREMADYGGSAFAALCGDLDSWVTVITETRNRLIHHDKERQLEFAPGDLYFITESAFMLVMLCLFRECQIDACTLDAIADTDGVRFLRSKLDGVVPRLKEQIKSIKEREWTKKRTADSSDEGVDESTESAI